MKKLIILIIGFLFISCNNQQKLTQEEMKAYENEIKEKVKASKVELVQLKLAIEELSDSLQADYSEKITDFEDQLNKAEDSFISFKNIENRDVWQARKGKLDSLLGYLQLRIDSTKINVDQMLQ